MLLSPILTLDPQKVDRDLAFVMDCLSEVLEESREHALARQLPWSRDARRVQPPVQRRVQRTRPTNPTAAPDTISPEQLSQAYSIAFHLLSMVEQNAAIQQQRSD